MEKIRFTVSSKVSKSYHADIVIYCIGKKNKKKADCSSVDLEELQFSSELNDFTGDEKDSIVLYGKKNVNGIKTQRVALLGTGIVVGKVDETAVCEKLRIVGGNIASLCRKHEAKKICLIFPGFLKSMSINATYCLSEGIVLGNYTFSKYITRKQDKKPYKGIQEVRIVCEEKIRALRQSVKLAVNSADATLQARDMANEPGSSWVPKKFADFAKKMAKDHGLEYQVLEKKDMQRLGMGGILAVNRGSAVPPKLVIVKYVYSDKAPTLILVGKGLTFDSGGVSLKPASGMEDMKYDMCGGAAVLAAMSGVAIEKPECNVIAVVPATDNMSGADAIKPGDIITHYNGTTAEVINTDAEGRLILADALAYSVDKYDPDYIIDLATLTGAVIVGLGHHYCGLMSNNDKLSEMLLKHSRETGEPIWRLPLDEQFAKQIESKVADIKNTGGKGGGAITAAEYLHKFVGKKPWAHLDIAGTAWSFTEKSYIPGSGASGFGVRTLIALIRNLK